MLVVLQVGYVDDVVDDHHAPVAERLVAVIGHRVRAHCDEVEVPRVNQGLGLRCVMSAHSLVEGPFGKESMLVVCLWAAWCDVCREFHPAFAGPAEATGTTGSV